MLQHAGHAGPKEDPWIGITLDRRYRIDRRIGSGGIGNIYAAWHLHLEREVAIKILHQEFLSETETVERFRQEALLIPGGQSRHPNIVEVLDFRYADERQPYLVMELLSGETLKERLSRGPLSLSEIRFLFRSFCDAMSFLHGRGILHGDLKPANLMIHQQGQAPLLKLLDFGCARQLGPAGFLEQSRLDQGTPAYLAPERVKEGARVDARVDLFAMGAILYECLTARRLFASDVALLQMVTTEAEVRIPEDVVFDPQVADQLSQLIRRATQRDPERRLPSASEFWRLLSLALASSGPAPKRAFSEAIARPLMGTVSPRMTPQVLPPAILSADLPLGAAVKTLVLRSLTNQLVVAGHNPELRTLLGEQYFERLTERVLTDWIDGAELHRLLAAARRLGVEDQGLLQMGYTFAEEAMSHGPYKPLLAEPGRMLRRTQVLLRLWFSSGISKVSETGRLVVMSEEGSAPSLWNRDVALLFGGVVQKTLSLCGAQEPHVMLLEAPQNTGPTATWVYDVNYGLDTESR